MYYNTLSVYYSQGCIVQKLKTELTTEAEDDEIDSEILKIVTEWNKGRPKGPNYFDFHGLTVFTAEQYLEEIVDKMLANSVTKVKIETGRGNHSVNGFAAIRSSILKNYQGYKGAKFVPEDGNDGVLVLTLPKYK